MVQNALYQSRTIPLPQIVREDQLFCPGWFGWPILVHGESCPQRNLSPGHHMPLDLFMHLLHVSWTSRYLQLKKYAMPKDIILSPPIWQAPLQCTMYSLILFTWRDKIVYSVNEYVYKQILNLRKLPHAVSLVGNLTREVSLPYLQNLTSCTCFQLFWGAAWWSSFSLIIDSIVQPQSNEHYLELPT